jgi:hypothetical protein
MPAQETKSDADTSSAWWPAYIRANSGIVGWSEPLRPRRVGHLTPVRRFKIEETSMPKQAHTDAATHHENAAKSHRSAADKHGKGDKSGAAKDADEAHSNSTKAHESSKTAHSKSKA